MAVEISGHAATTDVFGVEVESSCDQSQQYYDELVAWANLLIDLYEENRVAPR